MSFDDRQPGVCCRTVLFEYPLTVANRRRPLQPEGADRNRYRSMKNVVHLENHYSSWEFERAVARCADYDDHERLHEAIGNGTSDDQYHGRQCEMFTHRAKIKRSILERRKEEGLPN
jgi:hypothetical protein